MRWFTQFGLRPPEKFLGPSFIIIKQMKGYNIQQTCCNFLFILSQSPHSEYNIHNDPSPQYISLIKEGCLIRKKNPNITSTVRYVTL